MSLFTLADTPDVCRHPDSVKYETVLNIYYLFDIYLLSIYYLFDIYLLSTDLVEDDAVPDLVNLPDLDHAAGHVPGEDNEDGEGYTDIMVMSSLVGVPVPVLGVCPGADLQYSTVQYSIVQYSTVQYSIV